MSRPTAEIVDLSNYRAARQRQLVPYAVRATDWSRIKPYWTWSPSATPAASFAN